MEKCEPLGQAPSTRLATAEAGGRGRPDQSVNGVTQTDTKCVCSHDKRQCFTRYRQWTRQNTMLLVEPRAISRNERQATTYQQPPCPHQTSRDHRLRMRLGPSLGSQCLVTCRVQISRKLVQAERPERSESATEPFPMGAPREEGPNPKPFRNPTLARCPRACSRMASCIWEPWMHTVGTGKPCLICTWGRLQRSVQYPKKEPRGHPTSWP